MEWMLTTAALGALAALALWWLSVPAVQRVPVREPHRRRVVR